MTSTFHTSPAISSARGKNEIYFQVRRLLGSSGMQSIVLHVNSDCMQISGHVK